MENIKKLKAQIVRARKLAKAFATLEIGIDNLYKAGEKEWEMLAKLAKITVPSIETRELTMLVLEERQR